MRYLLALVFLSISSSTLSCSTGKVRTEPELSNLEGKKVALVQLDAEPTARTIVEAALVNQLVARGSFILISEREVLKARTAPGQDPADWKGIARAAGADYALRAKVLEFSAEQNESYAAVEDEDPQLEAERGSGKTEKIVKTHALEGSVKIQVEFANTGERDQNEAPVLSAIAEQSERLTADSRAEAVHLPAKLSFLEKLTNAAFRKFFERYN